MYPCIAGGKAGADKAAGGQALAADTAGIADSDYAEEAKSTEEDGEGGSNIAAAKAAADKADTEQSAAGSTGSSDDGMVTAGGDAASMVADETAAQQGSGAQASDGAASSKVSPENEVVLKKLARGKDAVGGGSSDRSGNAISADQQSEVRLPQW